MEKIIKGDKEKEEVEMKSYEKPRAYIERFELSQHIAACAWDMSNQSDQNNCTAESDPDWGMPSDLKMFTEAQLMCNVTPDIFEDFCYTASEGHNNLFSS